MGIKVNHRTGDISIDETGEAPTLGGKPIGSFSGLYVNNKINSVALGKDAEATHKGSVAIGYGAKSVADYTLTYRISPNENCKYSETFFDGRITGHAKGGFIYLNSGNNPFDFPNDTSIGFSFMAHGREERPGTGVGFIRLDGVAIKQDGKIEIVDAKVTSITGNMSEPELSVMARKDGISLGIKRLHRAAFWQVRGQIMHS